MSKTKREWQYSKAIVAITGVVFVCVLIFCFTRNIDSVYDLSLYTATVTVTGGVFGSALVWYEKKSQAENVSKIQLQHIKDTAKLEYAIYEKKLRLKKELGILCQSDIGMDDNGDFHIDEQVDGAVDRDSEYLSEKMNDATSDPEIQTY